MPKRLGKDDRPRDVNQLAQHLVRLSTGQDEDIPVKARAKVQPISGAARPGKVPAVTRSEVSRVMAAMGRKGGKNSAAGRMIKLTPEQRRKIALNAARARWAKPGKKRA